MSKHLQIPTGSNVVDKVDNVDNLSRNVDNRDNLLKERCMHQIFTGEELSVMGAQRAYDHAEFENKGWGDVALQAVKLHATRNRELTAEQVRKAFPSIPEPPDKRAWGHVMRRARSEGYIQALRPVKAENPSVHGMWVTLWGSLL